MQMDQNLGEALGNAAVIEDCEAHDCFSLKSVVLKSKPRYCPRQKNVNTIKRGDHLR